MCTNRSSHHPAQAIGPRVNCANQNPPQASGNSSRLAPATPAACSQHRGLTFKPSMGDTLGPYGALTPAANGKDKPSSAAPALINSQFNTEPEHDSDVSPPTTLSLLLASLKRCSLECLLSRFRIQFWWFWQRHWR